jgi:hypothetical protein
MDGITYIENFVNNPSELYDKLVTTVKWDERMSARKTEVLGKPIIIHKLNILIKRFCLNYL